MRLMALIGITLIVGLTPIQGAAGQQSGITQTKPISATPFLSCDTLLQHPLGWWLSSAPTPVEREQLAACMSGTARVGVASPSVTAPPQGNGVPKPRNWNIMTADEQATWTRLAPKTWAQMTEQERKDWSRILAPKVASAPASTPPPAAAASTVPARWTGQACESERQSLSLLSEQIRLQLQALAAQSPAGSTTQSNGTPSSYRCDSSTHGSQTTTTCEPEAKYASPGAAFSQAFEQSMTQQTAQKRWDAMAALIRSQQNQFDARIEEWNSHCATR
jgi:hypothetical protein